MRRWARGWVGLSVVAAACSLVNDPSRHMGGGGRDGGGSPFDGGGSTDAPGPGTDAPPPAPPLPATEACAEFTEAYCEAYATCCPAPMMMTPEQCMTRVAEQCQLTVEQYLADARTGYDAQRAGEILRRARELASTCDPGIVELYTYDLLTMLRGTLPERSICITPDSVRRMDYAGLVACRRDDGLVCRPTSGPFGDWSCQPFSVSGGACNYLYHCARGLYCTGSLLFSGTCAAQLANGRSCARAEECQSLYCAMGTCAAADANVYCIDPFPTTG